MNLEEYVARKKAIREQQEALDAETRVLFKDAISSLMAEHPNVVKVRWTQYTPYFNDGDACAFRCHASDASFWFTGEEEDDEGNGSIREDDVARGGITRENYDSYKAIQAFLDNFDDDDMLSMFDDHVEVVVTQDGITVEEYDHD